MDWLNIGDFLIGLIGLIIGLSPTGRRALKDYLKRRKFKRLLGNPGPACIVIPVHPDPTTDLVPRIHRMVKVETAMAVLRLRDHLRQLGWKVKVDVVRAMESQRVFEEEYKVKVDIVRPRDEQKVLEEEYKVMVDVAHSTDSREVLKERCKESTMFFLGSTRVTTVATELFEELESEFCFEDQSGLPRIVEKSKKYDSIAAEFPSPMDQGEDADYGLVIKTHNRFCPSHSVFWLAGIHAVGTWGATEFLCSDQGLHEVLSRVEKENFAAVVKTEFSGLLDVTKFEVKLSPRYFPRRQGE